VLQGIEVYRGKPIFYSLGNFIFENETIRRLPSDVYEMYGLGFEATPADVYDCRTVDETGKRKGFAADPRYWRSVVAMCAFEGQDLSHIELHPVTLEFEKARHRRGCPRMATEPLARSVIGEIARLSAPFGTTIDYEQGVGVAKLA
jgi:poly-gamma-glutamate synthesis protein (capsule biosynthesis protein)